MEANGKLPCKVGMLVSRSVTRSIFTGKWQLRCLPPGVRL